MENLYDELFGLPPNKINSKVKGNKNELVLAHSLSEWTGSEFNRVPQSGGLRWKNVMNVCGDLICTDVGFYFPFSVETKHLKTFKHPQKNQKRSLVYTLWKQAKNDGERAEQTPVMFLRSNGMPAKTWDVIFSVSDIEPLSIMELFQAKDLISYRSQDLFEKWLKNLPNASAYRLANSLNRPSLTTNWTT